MTSRSFPRALAVLCALLLSMVAGPVLAGAQDLPPAPAWEPSAEVPVQPGGSGEMSVDTPEGPRAFIIHVPTGYDRTMPTPVLFGFSGKDDSPENFRSYSQLLRTAGREAIVIYPRAIDGAWEGAPYATVRPGADVDFVRTIVEKIRFSYHLDPSRIYATGMSNGGGMAALLGCRATDLLAGVAPVSGAFYLPVESGCTGAPVPALFVHGTEDPLMSYDGGALHDAPYLSVPDTVGSYSARNGCWGPAVVTPAPGATRIAGANCVKEVQELRIDGGLHSWWYEPDTSAEVWGFLARQHR
ncbi:alpha/beta hydrolase family esterase [Corynebacterium doosanense]|uniref:Poly(3-hydroxybutyrate) depolymerase n=1 Tax=Corynebacterium doosanense CAU 212 = DSM 45436 TaxID=558173 RepID=A0A097IFM5_9CORY|nr:PHB depolymerase family esterase [Corynebacterium doosanense]AIT60933.1 poly(3-hydroxybutyrate) depolymerase [Corynebacterium doosanense CAU 212 = DSM 45436]